MDLRRLLSTSALLLGLLALVPSGAAASTLHQITANPNPAQPNQPVVFTVKSASGSCTFVIDNGDGVVAGPFGNNGGTKLWQSQYAQPGSYTASVKGKAGNGKAACGGGTKTVTVNVLGGGGGGGRGGSTLGRAGKGPSGLAVPTIPGNGPKKPPVNLKLGCDDLPCVSDVKIEPHGTFAEFEVFTTQAASIQIYASTKPLSPNSLGKPPHSTMSFGHKHKTTARMMNLKPGTKYHYVVKSVDENGVAMWKKGQFETLRRQVTLAITKIDVHNDGDNGTKGKGDFSVRLKARGEEMKFKFKQHSGKSYVPLHPMAHQIVWSDAPAQFPALLDIYERDGGVGFGVEFQSSENKDELSIWAGEAGLGEETQTTFTHHAVSEYDVTVHFRQIVSYVP